MKPITLLALVTLIISCNATKTNLGMDYEQAPMIIYKTGTDYYFNIPLTLDEAREKITAYPGPGDLYFEGELALPVKLDEGYLLDQRGINKNSAFTSFSYEAYSKLDSPPGMEELYDSILDKNPFEEIWDCGKRGDYTDPVRELNKLVRKGFPDCKRIK